MKKKFGLLTIMLICAVLSLGWVSGWHIHWIPETDDTYDIGSSTKEAKDIYSDGTIYSDGISLATNTDITPEADGTCDLGSGTYRYQKIYADAYDINGVTLAQNKSLRLPLMSFVISDDDGAVIGPITASTAPNLAYGNKAPHIIWADGELSYASIIFTVPEDYASGGAFRVLADETADGNSPCAIDFNVYNKTPGSAWDTTTTNQSIVLLTEAAGTPELMSLAVTTDFAALATGDYVVLEIWREDTTQDTASGFEVYEVYFTYD